MIMHYIQTLADSLFILIVIFFCAFGIYYVKKYEVLSGLYNTELANLATVILFIALWYFIKTHF